MKKLNVAGHGSYIGVTGINYHFREFFRSLSHHCNLKVRNFTVGSSWSGLSNTPHDNESYINEIDKKILYRQSLWTDEARGHRKNFPIYQDYTGSFDVEIVADIVDHHFFYDNYSGPKVAYTVWESTKYPVGFFNKLKEFDEVWAASKWQKHCLVQQGLNSELVRVVPAGVYTDVFFPENVTFDKYYSDGRFKFVVFGRWSRRKSTQEIIKTFLSTFDANEPVDLILSVENPYPEDTFKSTHERLQHFGYIDPRIKVVQYASREEYVKFMKKGHVFLSCSRGEGWNLPLLEAMACGTPSIYSNCSGQLEFAEGKGHPVNISQMVVDPTHPDHGEYCEPDFNHLSEVMRDVYNNYANYKEKAMSESVEIREKFNWNIIGKLGIDTLNNLISRIENKTPVLDGNKILYIAPHLSTGGMPQYLLKKIQLMKEAGFDVHCVEYDCIATWFTVQRDKIIEILNDKFITLKDRPKEEILSLISRINPNIIHFEEFPEKFISHNIIEKIYRDDRPYLIFESDHGIYFDSREKKFNPDKYLFVSEYQSDIYKRSGIPFDIIEYPIDVLVPNKQLARSTLGLDADTKHIINVGLFTPGKNQGEVIEYAKKMIGYKVKFHFIGNQAPNFETYWKPLNDSLPSNCQLWGERRDVHEFYQAADLMVFTSKMETSPIVIKEALSWGLKSLVYNLPSYKNMYNDHGNIKYLKENAIDHNVSTICNMLGIDNER